jgi:F-type H+-transporting ATPase subunit delta
MAENLTLARPYAEAAFQLAKASGNLAAWSDNLSNLAASVANPTMAECIGNPVFTAETLTQLCFDVAGQTLTADQQNFVRLLVDNERLTVLPEIADLFSELKNGHEGVKEAQISSAFAIDDATLQTLIASIGRKFGSKVVATVTIDPELIGGVRIAVGDEVIDASVRGQLATMATSLKH